MAATDLIVCGKNWWLERHEYDGAEWWEFKEYRSKPSRELKKYRLSGGLWAELENIDE